MKKGTNSSFLILVHKPFTKHIYRPFDKPKRQKSIKKSTIKQNAKHPYKDSTYFLGELSTFIVFLDLLCIMLRWNTLVLSSLWTSQLAWAFYCKAWAILNYSKVASVTSWAKTLVDWDEIRSQGHQKDLLIHSSYIYIHSKSQKIHKFEKYIKNSRNFHGLTTLFINRNLEQTSSRINHRYLCRKQGFRLITYSKCMNRSIKSSHWCTDDSQENWKVWVWNWQSH